MSEDNRLENPFAGGAANESSNDREGFLAFSSSTPRGPSHTNRGGFGGGSGFQPRRGKQNRRGNWERYGNYEQQQMQQMHFQQQRGMPSPFPHQNRGGFYGRGGGGGGFHSPRFRGSPGGPHGGYGHSPNFRGGGNRGGGRGNFNPYNRRGGRQHQQPHHQRAPNEYGGYFHPSMLDDPWIELERRKGDQSSAQMNPNEESVSEDAKLSDSMIPQVGESFFQRNVNPAPDVTDMSIDGDQQEEEEFEKKKPLSDSMVPLVGDSLLEKSETDASADAS